MRPLPAILATSLLLALAACGGDDQGGSGGNGADVKKLAIIPKGNTHVFWNMVKAGAEQADAELDGIEIVFKGPADENNLTQQKELMDRYRNQVDGIGVAPVDGGALAKNIEAATVAGVPVVVFDSGTTTDDYLSFVATDNYAGGKAAGEKLAELLGGEGKVIMLRYKAGSTSTEKREQGFLDAIAGHDGIEVISSDQEGAKREQQVASSLLVKYGSEVEGIFTCNESTTEGMMLALRKGDYYEKGVVHVGFDNSPDLIKSLKNGEIKALVSQDPIRMGYLTVKILAAHLAGGEVGRRIDTGVAVITPDNVDDPEIQKLLGD